MTDPVHPTQGNARFDASALWKQSTSTRQWITVQQWSIRLKTFSSNLVCVGTYLHVHTYVFGVCVFVCVCVCVCVRVCRASGYVWYPYSFTVWVDWSYINVFFKLGNSHFPCYTVVCHQLIMFFLLYGWNNYY